MPYNKVVVSSNSKHTSTIIFLHGLGDKGESWISLLEQIRPNGMKIVCPTANIIPVTLLDGTEITAWFDINTMDISVPTENEDSINTANQKIHTIINNEIGCGIASNHIMLGGFSQGGALAIYSGLTFTKPLAGIIALSCWLPLHFKFPDYVLAPENIPIFQAHGDNDLICPLQIAQLTNIMLKSYSKNVQFLVYNGLSHNISHAEAYDIKIFINHHIRTRPSNNYNLCCCLKGSPSNNNPDE